MARSLSVAARQLQDIRPFVDFDRNPKRLTAADKRLIGRYWEAIQSLQARGAYVYRPRNPERLKRAQAYAQHPSGLPRLRVAFIPTPTPGVRPRIRFSGKAMRVDTEHVTRVVWQLVDFERRKGETATDPLAVVQRILKHDRYSREFRLTCGEAVSGDIFTRDTVGRTLAQWVNQYGNWQKWLTGVIGYRFAAQDDVDAYYKAMGYGSKRKTSKRKSAKRNDPIRSNER